MNTRCKPGDLALIAYDVPGCEDNIGRAVSVRGPAAVDHRGRLTWLITPLTPEPYVIELPADKSFCFMEPGETNIEHPDAWMIPIDPEDLEEAIEYATEKEVQA